MSRPIKIIIAVAGLAVIAVGVVLLTSTGEATADQVRFQNVSDPGPKPFTSTPTDVPKASANTSKLSTGATSSSSSTSSSTSTEESSTPTQKSLTGGTAKPGAFTANTHCDREKLIAEVIADPAKSKAWADVVGIDDDPQAITAFIRKLHPVVLTEDTQVTNHSFVDGNAEGYQAILPKGTPVLANDEGDPVARCRCGNPLTKPVQLESTTKCINCPTNYSYKTAVKVNASHECNSKCFEPDPEAPPTPKPTDPPPAKKTDPIAEAKTKLNDCKSTKGALDQCQLEYAAARSLCAKSPFNPLCDSSICFNAKDALDAQGSGCGSYLEDGDIQNFCTKTGNKQQCLKILTDLQKKCAANPATPDCVGDPNLRSFKLRSQCTADAARPECVAVQAVCASKPINALGCDALRGTCQANPNRPDCTGLQKLQTACAQDNTKPECQGIPALQAAANPNLKQPDEQGDQNNPPDPGKNPPEKLNDQQPEGGADQQPEGGADQQPKGGGDQQPEGGGDQQP